MVQFRVCKSLHASLSTRESVLERPGSKGVRAGCKGPVIDLGPSDLTSNDKGADLQICLAMVALWFPDQLRRSKLKVCAAERGGWRGQSDNRLCRVSGKGVIYADYKSRAHQDDAKSEGHKDRVTLGDAVVPSSQQIHRRSDTEESAESFGWGHVCAVGPDNDLLADRWVIACAIWIVEAPKAKGYQARHDPDDQRHPDDESVALIHEQVT